MECFSKSNGVKPWGGELHCDRQRSFVRPTWGPYIGPTEEYLRAIWVQLAPRGNIRVETHCRKGDFVFFNWDGEGDWRRI